MDTAFGSIVLHVAPEAAVGGPLAAVRNGDHIRLSKSKQAMPALGHGARVEIQVVPTSIPLAPVTSRILPNGERGSGRSAEDA